MIRADAPFILWKLARKYIGYQEMLKNMLFKMSRGRIYIPNRRRIINFAEWLRMSEPWKKFMRETLLNKKALCNYYFNPKYIFTLIEEHENRRRDHSDRLAYLCSFEILIQLFH